VIDENLPPILQRLKLGPEACLKGFHRAQQTRFGRFIGGAASPFLTIGSSSFRPSSFRLLTVDVE